MSARSAMTMRCDTTREVDGDRLDRYDQPISEVQPVETDLACFVWPETEQRNTDASPPGVVTVAVHQMMVPTEADLEEGDQVLRVYNRRGQDIYPAMTVTEVVRLLSHKQATLREVS